MPPPSFSPFAGRPTCHRLGDGNARRHTPWLRCPSCQIKKNKKTKTDERLGVLLWSRTGSRLRAGRLDRSERKARAHDVWRAAGNEAGRGRADQPSLTLTRAFVFCRKYQSTNRQSSARARNLLFNIKYLDLVPSHRRMILLINTAREHEVGSLDASAGGRRRCLLHPCCHRTPPFLENERGGIRHDGCARRRDGLRNKLQAAIL